MGPVSDHQITISPPFFVTMLDLFGPLDVFVPGRERETRNRRVERAKVWIIVFVCPVSRLLNLQVIEGKSAEAIVDC